MTVTRSTPVPGHRRRIRRAPLAVGVRGWAAGCACGWRGHARAGEPAAVAEHTAHKGAVLSGEWAALFEAGQRADLMARAEPHDLIAEVQARIDDRNRSLAEQLTRRHP